MNKTRLALIHHAETQGQISDDLRLELVLLFQIFPYQGREPTHSVAPCGTWQFSLSPFSTTSLFQVKLLSYLEMLKLVRHVYGILAIAAAGCTALILPLQLDGEVCASLLSGGTCRFRFSRWRGPWYPLVLGVCCGSPGDYAAPFTPLSSAALCTSFHQKPLMGRGDRTVAEANRTSRALQGFFTTVAVLKCALAAQSEMLSRVIIHQLQKSPLQTLKYAISAKTIFHCSLYLLPISSVRI